MSASIVPGVNHEQLSIGRRIVSSEAASFGYTSWGPPRAAFRPVAALTVPVFAMGVAALPAGAASTGSQHVMSVSDLTLSQGRLVLDAIK
jgi:hypothetical protein